MKNKRKAGAPKKAPAQKLEVMVKFRGDEVELLLRAVEHDSDNRAHFCRRGALKLAKEVLGIVPPDPKK